jgi:hypothetical protein
LNLQDIESQTFSISVAEQQALKDKLEFFQQKLKIARRKVKAGKIAKYEKKVYSTMKALGQDVSAFQWSEGVGPGEIAGKDDEGEESDDGKDRDKEKVNDEEKDKDKDRDKDKDKAKKDKDKQDTGKDMDLERYKDKDKDNDRKDNDASGYCDTEARAELLPKSVGAALADSSSTLALEENVDLDPSNGRQSELSSCPITRPTSRDMLTAEVDGSKKADGPGGTGGTGGAGGASSIVGESDIAFHFVVLPEQEVVVQVKRRTLSQRKSFLYQHFHI